MTDIVVTVQEDPTPVIIDSGSRAVTITDSNTGDVTVIQASPVTVSAVEGNPTLIISGGGGTMANTNLMLEALMGRLTRLQMADALSADLEKLEALWIRAANELVLLESDGVHIEEVGREYTDQSILDIVASINLSVDGKFDVAYSYINQEVGLIDQRITTVEGETDARFVTAESRITQTEDSIVSAVSRLDTIDGEGGDIALMQSAISQNTSNINLEVGERLILDGELQEAITNLSLLTDSVSLITTTVDTLGNKMTSTELLLGEDGVNFTVAQQALNQHAYSISAIQEMLVNKWDVIIAESVGGNKYAAGFGIALHPTWILETGYVAGDTVYYIDTVYECLADHTATTVNAPTGAEGETYWEELVDAVKSEFTVNAESFQVLSPVGLGSLFSVDGEGNAYVRSEMLVGSLKSLNYGEEGESWFNLDPSTGLAEFNEIVLAIGSGSTGYNNFSDIPGSLDDINPTEYAALIDPAGVINSGTTTINGGKITTESITADQIGTNEIIAYAANIHDGVITSAKIGSLEVKTANIDTGAITNAKIGALAVDTAQIAALAVETAKINDLAVTEGKIANLAVDTLKIADQAVTIPVSAYTEGSISCPSTTTVQTAGINSSGAPILIIASVLVYVPIADDNNYGSIKVIRDSDGATIAGPFRADPGGTYSQYITISFCIQDTPGEGVETYYLKAGGSETSVTCYYRTLCLLETKK